MVPEKLKVSVASIAGGSVFFVGAISYTLALAQWNAQVSPNIPWFPLPVLGVLLVLVFWIDRRWPIGLVLPKAAPWGKIAIFAVASMVAGHCVLILEAAFHGATRSVEAAPDGVGPVFAIVYWIGFAISISIASEVAYRGLMQGRMTPLFGVWPAILIVTLVNTISHRWDGLEERALFLAAIVFAWGALRHLSGSLIPCILAHIGALVVWDAILRIRGPWDFSQTSTYTLWAVSLLGLVALTVSIHTARMIQSRSL